MPIEQQLPNKPNFGLILGLFCVCLLVLFGLALLFVHYDGKHLTFGHGDKHPTSRLVLPSSGRVGAPVNG